MGGRSLPVRWIAFLRPVDRIAFEDGGSGVGCSALNFEEPQLRSKFEYYVRRLALRLCLNPFFIRARFKCNLAV